MTEEKKLELRKKKLERQKLIQKEINIASTKRKAKLAKQREYNLKNKLDESAQVPELTKMLLNVMKNGITYRGKSGLDKLVKKTMLTIDKPGDVVVTTKAESTLEEVSENKNVEG